MAHPIYTPLPSTSHNIRLINLFPDAWKNEELECYLEEKPIDEARDRYITVSYTWGEINATKQVLITCNGHRIPISENLYTILRRIRRPDYSILVWADALCINQLDDSERTHQVRLMGEIYKNSAETVIWLGEQGPTDDTGGRFMVHCMSDLDWNIWREEGPPRITWYDDERDNSKLETYMLDYTSTKRLGARQNIYEGTLPRNDILGAFCLVYLLARGMSSSNVDFLECAKLERFHVPQTRRGDKLTGSDLYGPRAARVLNGMERLMSRPWVSCLFTLAGFAGLIRLVDPYMGYTRNRAQQKSDCPLRSPLRPLDHVCRCSRPL